MANLATTIGDGGENGILSLRIESLNGYISEFYDNKQSSTWGWGYSFAYDGRTSYNNQHFTVNSSIGGAVLTIYKNQITKLKIDGRQISPPSTLTYVAGSGTADYAYDQLLEFTANNLVKLGDGLCRFAPKLEKATISNSNLASGANSRYIFGRCFDLKEIVLDNVTGVAGEGFCEYCNNLESIYIPEGFSTTTAQTSFNVGGGSPAYINGVILKGPGAKAVKNLLPDNNGPLYYRKLILDPAWA